MSLTLTQKKALAIIPHFTGMLSFFGSCSILYDIWSHREHKLKHTYFRILLGMSVYDAISSFSMSLSTWPIPEGEPGVYGNLGNTQTCTAQGFFGQLILGSPFYSLMLAGYYLLLGRYHLTEEDIANRYERYMHLTAIVPSIGIAIAGLPLTLYNNANIWCWIAAWPAGSETFNGRYHSEIEYERGHGAWKFRWLFFYAPLWFVIVAITVIMILLTMSVRAEERASIILMLRSAEESNRRNSTRPEEDDEESPASLAEDVAPYPLPKPQVVFRLERSRKMFHQALFYVLAFYLTYWAATVNRMVQMVNGESYFFFMIMTAFFLPLQGFFNFLVYRRGMSVA